MVKLVCFYCEKEKSIPVCGRCREISKNYLAEMLVSEGRYLSEHNRNNKGPKMKLTATEQDEVAFAHRDGLSFRKIASLYGISAPTAMRIYRRVFNINQ